jgi:hypothetical protein
LIAWSKRLEALGTAATGNQKAADTEQTQGVNIGLFTMAGIPTPPRKRLVHRDWLGQTGGAFPLHPERVFPLRGGEGKSGALNLAHTVWGPRQAMVATKPDGTTLPLEAWQGANV